MDNQELFEIVKGSEYGEDEVVLKKYFGNEEHVVVPEGVTKIEWYAFTNSNLKSVTIPESIKDIDSRSFPDWGKTLADEDGFCRIGKFLVNYTGTSDIVRIPEGITDTGFVMFRNNHRMRKVFLPSTIEVIGNQSFSDCNALEEVVFPEDCTGFRKIEYAAFGGCHKLKRINVPESVQEIENDAFTGCDSLFDDPDYQVIGKILVKYTSNERNITIPEGINVIGCHAFDKCDSIESVIIPEGVKSIGEYAFFQRKTLKKAIIPRSVELIGRNAFCGCNNLADVDLTNVKEIREGAFSICSGLHEVSLGKVEKIGDGAFHFCTELRTVTLPESLRFLGKPSARGYTYSAEGAFSDTAIESILIPGSVEYIGTSTFSGCKRLMEIRIPASVKVIGEEAFNSCTSLEKAVLENGVAEIGIRAFIGCSALSDITVPDSVTVIGREAFLYCPGITREMIPTTIGAYGDDTDYAKWGIGDENGCIVEGTTLRAYTGRPGVVRVTDGVEVINEGVFSHLFRYNADAPTTQIILPDTVKEFNASTLSWNVDINIPEGYLRQRTKLPAKFTYDLVGRFWKDKMTAEDHVSLFLIQSGKDIKNYCLREMDRIPEEAARAFTKLVSPKSKAEFNKAAEFIYGHKDKISQDSIDEFHAKAVENGMTEAAGLIEPLASKMNTTESGAEQHEKTSGSGSHKEIETFCRECFTEYFINKAYSKAEAPVHAFDRVRYKDSNEFAPVFVAKCAVVPYMDLMEERPRNIGSYKKEFVKVSIIEDADKVAEELDRGSLIEALEKATGKLIASYKKPRLIFPMCRYGDGGHINELTSAMNKWSSWYQYGASGRSGIMIARGAIMLNDSREAMLYAEKSKCLGYYARLRGLDEESFRDTRMADFGLDKDGKKILDLGSTKVEVSVGKDLELTAVDLSSGKTLKSIPKKGADPEKYEAASAEYSDLKKNLKKVVKARNDILFESFLNGGGRFGKNWKTSYLGNPVLRRVAELIVWTQEGNTFIVGDNGPVDSTGAPYEIREDVIVGVAHPMEMPSEEVTAWQKYFTSNGLKQPFEQIWEPAIDRKSIKKDRYEGIMIPFYRFRGQSKNGITVEDYDFHNDIQISFEGFSSEVERIDWRRHDIDMNDRFEIKSIVPGRRFTRMSNHVIAYLDRVSIYGRILKEEPDIINTLPEFTIAQITDFIRFSEENGCTASTATLIDFKNKNFGDYDPMDEFVL